MISQIQIMPYLFLCYVKDSEIVLIFHNKTLKIFPILTNLTFIYLIYNLRRIQSLGR